MDRTLGIRELDEICRLIRPAKEKWETIGLGLGLSPKSLNQIKTARKEDPGQCLYSAISDWLHHKGKFSKTTWRTLTNTLGKVNETALAETIMTKKALVPRSKIQKPKVPVPHMDKKFTDDSELFIHDLPWLQRQLKSIAPDWFQFGLQLHLSYTQLSIIRKDNQSRGCEDCLSEILALWLNRTPTAGELLNAVNDVDKKSLACTLKKSLEQGVHRRAPTCEWTSLEQHQRTFYRRSSQLGGTTDWPPALPIDYINLELVHQEKLPTPKLYNQQAVKVLQKGEVSAYLSRSKKLDLEDISKYDSQRKVIIIEGVPGVGKTTLAHKLCRDWAERKLLLEFSLVLYVPLRVPRIRLADSADDLLEYFGDHCSHSDIESIKYSQGSGVLFILDGWDELLQSCRLSTSFFPRLVVGEFLPKSSVLVTSRPGVVTPVLRTQVANRLIEICGFTQEQVRQYIISYFQDEKSWIAQKLIDDLQAYPNVASTCYVAINLTIICYVYQVSDFSLPATLTEVYEQFVIHAITRHTKRAFSIETKNGAEITNPYVETISGFNDPAVNKVLKGLGCLALDGILQGSFTFTRDEVARACCLGLSEEFDGFGLLRVLLVFRRHGPERNYQFLHLTVQEYLAGYTVSQMAEDQQRSWLRENLTNDTCEMVLRFFCGTNRFKSYSAISIFSAFITTPFILECIFEAQWKEACQLFAKKTSSLLTIHSQTHILPYRSLVYGYVMANSGTQWHLKWTEGTIGEHELRSICQHLQPTTILQLTLVQISFETKESADELTKLICSQEKLTELTLHQMQLSNDELHSLSKAFVSHKALKSIKLTQNTLPQSCHEDIGLLTSIPSLEVLDFSGTVLTENNCQIIIETASKNKSLKVLHLSHKSDSLLLIIKKFNTERMGRGLDELTVLFS